MARRPNSTSCCCAFCESSNLASICPSCVNFRLHEYNSSLKYLKRVQNSLYQKLEAKLAAKKKLDEQRKWRILHNAKITNLKERLHSLDKELSIDKAKVATISNELKVKSELVESSLATLEKTRVELLERFYQNLNCTQNLGHVKSDSTSGSYDQICNARLPRGLDPQSVPSEELAASLGYMVQLLNLVVPKLAAPALHNSGFAGSSSCIWQRDSYWEARPSSQSKEYPLYIPRQNFPSGGDTSWSDKSSSNFGVASVKSERKPYLDAQSSSFNYSSAPDSQEMLMEQQKGIALLKKSVACITAYCYNSLGVDVPAESSTFEAFAKLLAILSSSREMRSVLSLKMANPRNNTKTHWLNKTAWNVNSVSSSRLTESAAHTTMPRSAYNISNSVASFLYAGDHKITERLEDGWDLVEFPTFPPPPSEVENYEDLTRAMFVDATKN